MGITETSTEAFLQKQKTEILHISIMDLRTRNNIERKVQEAKQKRNEAAEKRRQAQIKKDAARAKEREEELYDKKAEEATKHAEKLRRERDSRVDRIKGYHRHIDGCTQEMSKSQSLF